ncbi:MAG TPA: GDSL-type esterase/lipase family protein [Acidimicrobiales bacterium]|nr:GDSL-type esterase/lipase family protein [Acidimicrobiales bacterium]
MRIPLPDERIGVEGAVDVDVSPTGITPRRMAKAYRHQLPMEVEFLASSPSGVRLRFATDSRSVGLELLATHLGVGETVYAATIDLVADGERVGSIACDEGNKVLFDPGGGGFEFIPGEPVTLRFTLAAPAQVVEVWLPNNSVVEVHAVHLDEGAAVAAAPDPRPRWVHHGSSISHCMEAYSGSRTWPATAATIAGMNLTNLGLAGQCHLDQFSARTIRDCAADLLSLKCGINVVNGDTLRMRTFAPALHGFIDTVRDGHPGTPFLVVSPIICPAHEDAPGPTDSTTGVIRSAASPVALTQGALTLTMIREIISDVVRTRRKAGDANLHYLDGRELFNEDDLHDLPDGLHPNGDGYVRMGERFAELAFGDTGPLH